MENKHYFCEVKLLQLDLLTKLLVAPKACFPLSNAGLNIKIRQLVSENGRLKDGYQVQIKGILTISHIHLQ